LKDEAQKREFVSFFGKHTHELYARAVKATCNTADAESLVQETALKAYKYFHRFDKVTNFRAWIHRILTNNIINHYRKTKSRPTHFNLDSVAHRVEDRDVGFWQELNKRSKGYTYTDIFDDEIIAAIAKLPQEYRTVVLLADVEGLTYKEIVTSIQRPLGTVMSRLHRGRKMLRRRLAGYARDNGYIVS